MRAAVIVIVLFGACSFDEPRFDGSSFRCDDAHPCPSPQRCLGGMCTDIASTADGVACGTAGQCEPGETCCASAIAAPKCLPPGQVCDANSAMCDGANDCASGMQCCDNSDPQCGAADCSPAVCSSNDDCSGSRPTCCFLTPSPWGICSVC